MKFKILFSGFAHKYLNIKISWLITYFFEEELKNSSGGWFVKSPLALIDIEVGKR